ncbi:NAD(P)-binding protein [Daedalea quercina L-15889]|uniref:D-xylose 1-dehydrogenase (NADP(+), D-xylono-1,5-lactone-forming) n=1 Tax=Daedalea quercina L-15889 TaxID=1314783 RepID=A0A165PSA1_9APHY|nr:NAD(P)-binding protein [Daedalea quercina L-15889]
MAGVLNLSSRLRKLLDPPDVPAKSPNALRFGVLGAARIAPIALITPAASHADVVVTTVASRDERKANEFAKKYKIPTVYHGSGCYQQLLDDPNIDAVYNPLPNGLHYEWTVKALNAGKHVLLEKPAANTSAEAQQMVDLAAQKGLVLLEAIHWIFHPAGQRVKEIVDSGELGKLKNIQASFALPKVPYGIIFFEDDIRFNYDLGGGATMDMGVYPLSAVRYFSSSDLSSVSSASAIGHVHDPARIDRAMRVHLVLQSSVEADVLIDFAMPGWGPFHIIPRMPKCDIHLELEGGAIDFYNFVAPTVYHSITVKPRGKKARVEKVYKFKDGPGQEWWATYRYQLEAFVDKVRGRTPQTWLAPDGPIKQMQWVESVYAAAEFPARPTSAYYQSSA